MRTILAIILVTLATHTNASEQILYCTPDNSIGFAPSENYKQHTYKLNRFTLKLDYSAKTARSKAIYLSGRVKCIFSGDDIYCLSDFGTAFGLNSKTNRFHHASVFISDDDIHIEYGKCEKF